ncbi:MAG: TetR/AcrR family transcriptional regulator [Erysipelotrichales bacterium]|nr:TetR/AcrR family transcriptional regulator [Erysipelotrichales bacterium]
MYKICKTQQSYKRQRLIEDVLVQMMQKEHFNTIKISEICQKADIPRKAFYRYFDTKDDVLYAAVDHVLLDFAEICGFSDADKFFSNVEMMEEFFKFWKKRINLIKALEISNCSSLLVERTVYLENNGEDNTLYGLSANNELKERNVFTYTGLFSVMITWIRTSNKTPREMAEITVQILTNPLFETKECS